MTSADTLDGEPRATLRVAYIVSRYPRLTETFVVEEAHAVRRAGIEIDLYPLWVAG